MQNQRFYSTHLHMTTNGHEPISKDLISNFVSKTPNFTPGYSKCHTTSSPFDDADINFPSELLKKFTSRYFFKENEWFRRSLSKREIVCNTTCYFSSFSFGIMSLVMEKKRHMNFPIILLFQMYKSRATISFFFINSLDNIFVKLTNVLKYYTAPMISCYQSILKYLNSINAIKGKYINT